GGGVPLPRGKKAQRRAPRRWARHDCSVPDRPRRSRPRTRAETTPRPCAGRRPHSQCAEFCQTCSVLRVQRLRDQRALRPLRSPSQTAMRGAVLLSRVMDNALPLCNLCRTLALTCCRKPQRGTSVGWRQSGAVLCWAASRNAGVFSALGRNLAGEGLGHDLAVPHDERVRAYLVHVVGSLRGPQNVGIVALDGLLLHAECCARFAKLRKHRLEQWPNRVGSPERSVRREQDGARRIVREDAREVALTETLYVVV